MWQSKTKEKPRHLLKGLVWHSFLFKVLVLAEREVYIAGNLKRMALSHISFKDLPLVEGEYWCGC